MCTDVDALQIAPCCETAHIYRKAQQGQPPEQEVMFEIDFTNAIRSLFKTISFPKIIFSFSKNKFSEINVLIFKIQFSCSELITFHV